MKALNSIVFLIVIVLLLNGCGPSEQEKAAKAQNDEREKSAEMASKVNDLDKIKPFTGKKY